MALRKLMRMALKWQTNAFVMSRIRLVVSQAAIKHARSSNNTINITEFICFVSWYHTDSSLFSECTREDVTITTKADVQLLELTFSSCVVYTPSAHDARLVIVRRKFITITTE
jgi:hypothetical protein